MDHGLREAEGQALFERNLSKHRLVEHQFVKAQEEVAVRVFLED
ncbi:hypothetical protein [Myxococcus xanthus]|nr:hypothetical protein [Myxococcus xanthus]